ncbi:aldehyde dehydrogenase family 16 member A1 [Ammospiza maritima maritima]
MVTEAARPFPVNLNGFEAALATSVSVVPVPLWPLPANLGVPGRSGHFRRIPVVPVPLWPAPPVSVVSGAALARPAPSRWLLGGDGGSGGPRGSLGPRNLRHHGGGADPRRAQPGRGVAGVPRAQPRTLRERDLAETRGEGEPRVPRGHHGPDGGRGALRGRLGVGVQRSVSILCPQAAWWPRCPPGTARTWPWPWRRRQRRPRPGRGWGGPGGGSAWPGWPPRSRVTPGRPWGRCWPWPGGAPCAGRSGPSWSRGCGRCGGWSPPRGGGAPWGWWPWSWPVPARCRSCSGNWGHSWPWGTRPCSWPPRRRRRRCCCWRSWAGRGRRCPRGSSTSWRDPRACPGPCATTPGSPRSPGWEPSRPISGATSGGPRCGGRAWGGVPGGAGSLSLCWTRPTWTAPAPPLWPRCPPRGAACCWPRTRWSRRWSGGSGPGSGGCAWGTPRTPGPRWGRCPPGRPRPRSCCGRRGRRGRRFSRLLCQRCRGGGRRFYPPTLISGVAPTSRCLREPVPGPVLVLLPVRGPSEAVAAASALPHATAATLWAQDITVALDTADRLPQGLVSLNSLELPEPFGGCDLHEVLREFGCPPWEQPPKAEEPLSPPVTLDDPGDPELAQAVAAARGAAPGWGRLPGAARARVLRGAAAALPGGPGTPEEGDGGDTGGSLRGALLRWAERAERAGGAVQELPGGRALLTRRSLGVLGVAWGWPRPLALELLLPALALGNAVVVMAPPGGAGAAQRLRKALVAAGLPGGALSVLSGASRGCGPRLARQRPDGLWLCGGDADCDWASAASVPRVWGVPAGLLGAPGQEPPPGTERELELRCTRPRCLWLPGGAP